MDLNNRHRILIKKYLFGEKLTDQELREIKIWISDPEHRRLFDDMMDETGPDILPETDIEQPDLEEKLQEFKARYILPNSTDNTQPTGFRWKTLIPYAAAAVVIFIATFAFIVFKYQNKTENNHLVSQQEENILPGSDKALLTLADGSVVSLSDVEQGKIALQGGLLVEKKADGSLAYSLETRERPAEMVYNTVTTPRGGQYRVALPDGSIVVLNAASTLTYPVHFSDSERRVTMTGEAYFEVTKWTGSNRKKPVPFIVDTDRQEVLVLGTQFNVNAYGDDSYIRTTLVEGSVRVTSVADGTSILLAPGQQSVLSDRLDVQQADMQRQLAWKNGEFVFKGEPLENLLKQVGRWYDVDIECPPRFGKIKFSGIISRSMPISTVMDMIESTQEVQINRKGRRLIVSD